MTLSRPLSIAFDAWHFPFVIGIIGLVWLARILHPGPKNGDTSVRVDRYSYSFDELHALFDED
jgi:hypothetical protein